MPKVRVEWDYDMPPMPIHVYRPGLPDVVDVPQEVYDEGTPTPQSPDGEDPVADWLSANLGWMVVGWKLVGDYKLEVELPYEMTTDQLVLDPSSKDTGCYQAMEDLNNRIEYLDEAELDIIFRSTTLLYQTKAGTWGECLDTALVWFFG